MVPPVLLFPLQALALQLSSSKNARVRDGRHRLPLPRQRRPHCHLFCKVFQTHAGQSSDHIQYTSKLSRSFLKITSQSICMADLLARHRRCRLPQRYLQVILESLAVQALPVVKIPSSTILTSVPSGSTSRSNFWVFEHVLVGKQRACGFESRHMSDFESSTRASFGA